MKKTTKKKMTEALDNNTSFGNKNSNAKYGVSVYQSHMV